MKPLVIIPARGGSKGVPDKNIKLLGDLPLITYTLNAAREIFPDSAICVSTDDIKIKSLVETTGLPVPFLRPEELADDKSSMDNVLIHALDNFRLIEYEPDVIILLQPTSPFRKGFHIQAALELFDENCEIVVSVKETRSNPYFILYEENKEGWLKKSKEGRFSNRQDCPRVWEINGAIYIIKVETLKSKSLSEFDKIKKYIMDEVSSLDINTQHDWDIAELMLGKINFTGNYSNVKIE